MYQLKGQFISSNNFIFNSRSLKNNFSKQLKSCFFFCFCACKRPVSGASLLKSTRKNTFVLGTRYAPQTNFLTGTSLHASAVKIFCCEKALKLTKNLNLNTCVQPSLVVDSVASKAKKAFDRQASRKRQKRSVIFNEI